MSTTTHFSNADLPCDCGCARSYPAFTGLLSHEDGSTALFMVALTRHGDARNAWLAIGSGPWSTDDARDCFVSVVVWGGTEDINCAIKDESPWLRSPLFRDDSARMVSRAEVMAQSGAKEWVFRNVDVLVALEPSIRAHLTAL